MEEQAACHSLKRGDVTSVINSMVTSEPSWYGVSEPNNRGV